MATLHFSRKYIRASTTYATIHVLACVHHDHAPFMDVKNRSNRVICSHDHHANMFEQGPLVQPFLKGARRVLHDNARWAHPYKCRCRPRSPNEFVPQLAVQLGPHSSGATIDSCEMCILRKKEKGPLPNVIKVSHERTPVSTAGAWHRTPCCKSGGTAARASRCTLCPFRTR